MSSCCAAPLMKAKGMVYMPGLKKTPMRQCLGCRTMKPKKELCRVVKSPDNVISLDLAGKKSGRGAYVCPQAACLQKAQKSRALERNLSTSIPESVIIQLQEQVTQVVQSACTEVEL